LNKEEWSDTEGERGYRRFVCDVCGASLNDEDGLIEDGELHMPPAMISRARNCLRGRWRRVPGYTPHPGPFPVGERSRPPYKEEGG
jgi:hypothetical protein